MTITSRSTWLTAMHPQSLLCYEMYGMPLDPRTRRSVASEHSHEDWLQAGEVSYRPQSEPRTGKGRLLGRSRLFGILWSVARRDDNGHPRNRNRRREDGRSRPIAVYEHPFVVRLCHWVNAVALFVMVGSGLQIFRAFPSFGAKIPQKDLLNWPKAFRARRMAGRRAAVAPHVHVDLHRDRTAVSRLPDFQRQLQAGALCTPRPAGSVADGAPLLFLRP